MSTCGEFINFSIQSIGRNRFLQKPTGLFGGDANFGGNSYQSWSDHYRSSVGYSTIMVTEDSVRGMKCPLACWFAMGSCELGNFIDDITLTVNWFFSDTLFENIKTPNQMFTFAHNGTLHHAYILRESTTKIGVLRLQSDIASDTSLKIGTKLNYMIRPQAPDYVFLGPILAVGKRQVQFQVTLPNNYVLPEKHRSLLYLGALESNPEKTCSLHNPADARENIFACEAIEKLAPNVKINALDVKLDDMVVDQWIQLEEHIVVAFAQYNSASTTFTFSYQWPFASVLKTGNVWIIGNKDTNKTYPSSVKFENPSGMESNGELWIGQSYATLNRVPFEILLKTEPTNNDNTTSASVEANNPNRCSNFLIVFERTPKILLSLQNSAIRPEKSLWQKMAENLITGSFIFDWAILTGLEYTWPFPLDQDGLIWCFTPQEQSQILDLPSIVPKVVCFARYVTNSVPTDALPYTTKNEKIYVITEKKLYIWTGQQGSVHSERPRNPNVFVVSELDTQAIMFAQETDLEGVAWKCIIQKSHQRTSQSVSIAVPSEYVFENLQTAAITLFTRRQDLLYALQVANVTSNFYTKTDWILPADQSSDRFVPGEIANALLGVAPRYDAISPFFLEGKNGYRRPRPITPPFVALWVFDTNKKPKVPMLSELILTSENRFTLKDLFGRFLQTGSFPLLVYMEATMFSSSRTPEYKPLKALGTEFVIRMNTVLITAMNFSGNLLSHRQGLHGPRRT